MKFFKYIFSLIIVFLMISCGANIVTPDISVSSNNFVNFRYKADSAAPGDFRGPFEGVVRDANSKFPLQTVKVVAYYYFSKNGKILYTIKSSSKTDVNGKYYFKRFNRYSIWSKGLTLSSVGFSFSHNNYFPKTILPGKNYFTQFGNIVFLHRDSIRVRSTTKVLNMLWSDTNIPSAYYKASSEISNLKSRTFDSGSLLESEQVMRLIGRKNKPRITQLRSNSEESGYMMSFSKQEIVSWNVWSLLSKQAENKTIELRHALTNVRKTPSLVAGGENWIGKSGNTNTFLILNKREGIIILVGCKGEFCSGQILEKLGMMAQKRSSMLLFLEEWKK